MKYPTLTRIRAGHYQYKGKDIVRTKVHILWVHPLTKKRNLRVVEKWAVGSALFDTLDEVRDYLTTEKNIKTY